MWLSFDRITKLYLSFALLYSLFILTKGATKERAFEIGQEIVNEVTAANPKPVKLKFEKVPLYFSRSCLCGKQLINAKSIVEGGHKPMKK